MKPSIGRVVVVPMDPMTNNGSDRAPALITRVFSDTLVNVRVLGDSEAIGWRTSLQLVEEDPGPDVKRDACLWWWPPRVE